MELDLNEVEQVEIQPVPRVPPIEEIVRQAGINVGKFDAGNGITVTVLQFITPVKIYTFQLDDDGCDMLIERLRPSKIVRATPLDLPPGVRV